MNILWISCDSGKIMSSETVSYANEGEGVQSEQSVVVYENKAVVVNNWFDNDKVPLVCRLLKDLRETTGFPTSDKIV